MNEFTEPRTASGAATTAPDTDVTTPAVSQSRDTLELLSTVLLALAAIAIAWAGFQSAKWGGVQAASTMQAGAARTESVRASTLAGQQTQVDVSTFFIWLESVVDDIDNGRMAPPASAAEYEPTVGTLSGFTFERVRDEFRPALEAWLDTEPFRSTDAPGTPFELPEYQLDARDQAAALEADADRLAGLAGDANQTSDNYVMTAVLFASALFFAALSGKLRSRKYEIASLVLAAVVFTGTLAYLFTLPIEV